MSGRGKGRKLKRKTAQVPTGQPKQPKPRPKRSSRVPASPSEPSGSSRVTDVSDGRRTCDSGNHTAMSELNNAIAVHVCTGDVQGGGTNANAAITIHDINGIATEKIKLDHFFKKDFERGNPDLLEIPREKTGHLEKVHKLEIFRDDSGFGSAWFVEKILLEDRSTEERLTFPVFRWLKPNCHYIFEEHDTSLPQDDEQTEQRKLDLEENRKTYEIDMTDLDFPAMVKSLPENEQFSIRYGFDIVELYAAKTLESNINMIFTDEWKSIDDIKNIYGHWFYEPKTTAYWSEDWFFGYQRLNGPVPNIIRLCTRIPEKLAVKEKDIKPFLEGKSVQQALDKKTLFACNLGILHGVKVKSTGDLGLAPIVLLYRNLKNQLLPIAIQLYQEPSPKNPVFLPSDDKNTWLLAKMWYNHAETTYHQGLAHLGFTHLMMEGVCLALHRNVSISHPIFKLLAPHLLYLLAINNFGVKKLLPEGGWIDQTMSAGSLGVIELLKKRFRTWRLDVDGSLPDDLKERGVYDKDLLPDYHYRDDALLLHGVIQKYVEAYVNIYYDIPSKLRDDVEIRSWSKEMKMSRKEGGMAISGIRGEIRETRQLVKMLTSIIFTCSVQHAAVNFPQYDYYGFPPVYSVDLGRNVPTDKKSRTKKDLFKALPSKEKTLNAMVMTTILSNKDTNSLGDFEFEYISDPKATLLVEKFREDLKVVGETIVSRNKKRSDPYDYLHPDSVPNAISI